MVRMTISELVVVLPAAFLSVSLPAADTVTKQVGHHMLSCVPVNVYLPP